MKRNTRKVYEFINNQSGFNNKHDVEFIAFDDESICAASDWPGTNSDGDMYVELFYESQNMDDFVETFGVTTVESLNEVSPETMLRLFHKGHLEACCAIDTPYIFYQLHFTLRHNRLMAADEKGFCHEVTESLKTVKEFMDYTHQRYVLSEILGPGV
jgi:hypothetical protein